MIRYTDKVLYLHLREMSHVTWTVKGVNEKAFRYLLTTLTFFCACVSEAHLEVLSQVLSRAAR